MRTYTKLREYLFTDVRTAFFLLREDTIHQGIISRFLSVQYSFIPRILIISGALSPIPHWTEQYLSPIFCGTIQGYVWRGFLKRSIGAKRLRCHCVAPCGRVVSVQMWLWPCCFCDV